MTAHAGRDRLGYLGGMLTAAAVVLVALALLHSILAELLIFRHAGSVTGLPALGFPPTLGRPDSPMGIIRACWHALTVFGLAFALILGRFGALSVLSEEDRFAVQTIAGALVASAALICVSTRGKHIGWIAFLAAAALAWLGAR